MKVKKIKKEGFQTGKGQTKDSSEESVRQTDSGEVDGHGEDDEGHDPEHGLHGSQVGVVDTRLGAQLKKKKWHPPTNIYHFNIICPLAHTPFL